MFIPRTGSRAEGLRINPNVLASTRDLIAAVRADRRLWSATLIANWFWAFGAVVLSLMPTLVRQRLGGDENLYIVFLTVFSVSIAIGSGLAAWLAHGRILLLPTPVAGVLMSVFAIDVGVATWSASAAWNRLSARLPRDAAWRAHFPRPVLHGGRRRAVHRAGLLRNPVLGRGRPSRPSGRREQCRLGGLYRRRGARRRRIAGRGVQRRAGLRRSRPRRDRRRPRRLPRVVFRSDGRPAVDHLPHALPHGGERARKHRQGGTERHPFAQPHQLPRRGARHVAVEQSAGLCDRLRHRQALVGEAVPASGARHPARPDKADGDAHLDPGRPERPVAGDLPGRAPDRHRQPDEGL